MLSKGQNIMVFIIMYYFFVSMTMILRSASGLKFSFSPFIDQDYYLQELAGFFIILN